MSTLGFHVVSTFGSYKYRMSSYCFFVGSFLFHLNSISVSCYFKGGSYIVFFYIPFFQKRDQSCFHVCIPSWLTACEDLVSASWPVFDPWCSFTGNLCPARLALHTTSYGQAQYPLAGCFSSLLVIPCFSQFWLPQIPTDTAARME